MRLVQVLLTLAFLGAGVSKLRNSGVAWITSDTMAASMVIRHQPMGVYLAKYGWLCHLIAAATVDFEIMAPWPCSADGRGSSSYPGCSSYRWGSY